MNRREFIAGSLGSLLCLNGAKAVYHQKVIRITAMDSPNVIQKRDAYPGLLTWGEYQHRRKHWDKRLQCEGLDAQFYEGPEIKLYPLDWMNRANEIAATLKRFRPGKGLGIDTGEGEAETSWAVVDELGLIELIAHQTPDTSVIPGKTLAIMRKYGIAPNRVCFDRGGGGKEHADHLRRMGYPVRTIAFGSAIEPDVRKTGVVVGYAARLEQREEKYVYKNRRAQMFHELSLKLDPCQNPKGWGIPAEYTELRRQMLPIPKSEDEEGRIFVLPKQPKPGQEDKVTLLSLLGCSPDQLDSLVLAVHAMLHVPKPMVAGAR